MKEKYELSKKEHLETLKWFEKFYKKNKKLVDIILSNDKNKMIKYKIPDIWEYLYGNKKEIEVYRIKGYTKFNWNELEKCGTTLKLIYYKGKPQICYCYSNYYPEIRIVNDKQYLDENVLKRLKEVFETLLINLETYKKYKQIIEMEIKNEKSN